MLQSAGMSIVFIAFTSFFFLRYFARFALEHDSGLCTYTRMQWLYSFGKVLPVQTNDKLLNELKPLISDEDLHLLHFGLPSVFKLSRSPLIQGQSLDSLLELFAAFVRTNDKEFSALVNALVESATAPVSLLIQCRPTRQSHNALVLCINSVKNMELTVSESEREIEDARSTDSLNYMSLVTLGDVGRRASLDYSSYIDFGHVHRASGRGSSAAAYAIGNVSAINVGFYVPIVVQDVKADSKKRYLLLHALKEVITRFTQKQGGQELEAHASEIWTLLFDNCESQEEGTRNVVAECLGKLTLTDPYKFLPELQTRLRSESPQIRGTVLSAFKYTFTDNTRSYDELLRPLIVEFLSLMKDKDLNVRRLSLSTLDSAAHNNPYLIRDVLGQLLPLLYQETNVVEELVHIVEMRPFNHRVDDGLVIHK